MHISEYINEDKLKDHILTGLVYPVKHPTLPLVLYTFTRSCVYNDIWDEVTTKCRGLIVQSETGEIIARPFEKFFNIDTLSQPETHRANLPDTIPSVMEKLDGSLGIYWTYNGEYGIATKGSFVSEQAIWATQWLRDKWKELGDIWLLPYFPHGYTPVFEIVCEHIQHHVVHYGENGLTLLALIDNQTGAELSYRNLKLVAEANRLKLAPKYDKTLQEVLNEDRPNCEGYVLSYSRALLFLPPIKIKVKHPTFLKHQRIMHSATPLHIYEALAAGDVASVAEWVTILPENLRDYVLDWVNRFNTEYRKVFNEASGIVKAGLVVSTTRKDLALFFNQPKNRPFASVCFGMVDSTDHLVPSYKKLIWKIVKGNIDMKTEGAFTEAFTEGYLQKEAA